MGKKKKKNCNRVNLQDGNSTNIINAKKRVPQIRPPAILLNTFGSVWKIRPGPAPGSTPYAKQAGKIIRPAVIATNVSRTVTLIASPISALSFLR